MTCILDEGQDILFWWMVFEDGAGEAVEYFARRREVFMTEQQELEAIDIIRRLANRLNRYAYNDIDAERGQRAMKLIDRADKFLQAWDEDEQDENE